MAQPPNIVLLFPDQLRAGFLGCYGAGFVRTPHIDALAAEGLRYTRAYSASPVCVPARVSLLTGLNAIRTGVLDNSHFLSPHYGEMGIRTWPELLSEAGYHTAGIGKMHYYPWDGMLGFQERVIAEDKIWIHVQDDYAEFLAHNGYRKTIGHELPEYHENHGAFVSDRPYDLQVDRYVGQQACRFIREYDRDQPFALMVGFPGPHHPYDPSAEYAAQYDPADMPAPIPGPWSTVDGAAPVLGGSDMRARGSRAWYAIENPEFTERHMRVMRARYAALVAQIDHEVGEILAALRARAMLDNTLIVFTSDHGDYLGDHDLTGKNSFYEQATRVPMIVRGSQGAPAGRSSDALVEVTDLYATMLAAAGVAVPAYADARPLPGQGEGRPYIVGMLRSGWMIRDERWKLAKYAGGQVHLFDLQEDPAEEHNRYGDPACAEVFCRLDEALTREIVRSVGSSAYERRAMEGSLSSSPEFGSRGWRRTYPGRVTAQ